MAAGAIEAKSLRKRYGSVVALDGVDLSVETGTVFGLLGPNGAGKTTAVRILTSSRSCSRACRSGATAAPSRARRQGQSLEWAPTQRTTGDDCMAVREAEPVGSLQEVKEAGLDREDLLGIYRSMLITRGIEERGHILYKQGKIPGSFYTGRGNEAAAVGVGTAMGPNDVGTPLHRDMGVHVTRGVEPWRVFAQYMGREGGPTRGRDGNVHMAVAELGLHTMVSHLPAMLPVAGGMALAFKIRGDRRVAVGWFGEGAAARGDAHEAMNFAGVRQLPMVFICDNNQWAYSTPTYLSYPVEHIADRAAAYGFEGVVVDGTDVLAVYREAKRAIEKAREGGGPTLVECLTLRMEGHAVHDDAFYVPKEMFEQWAAYDPIERYRTWLQNHADLSEGEESEITATVKRLLNDALDRADASPLPDPSTLEGGVFASQEDLDTPHHK
jgi:TPP-dependent pyruvate/acetoin dehydrogenase alpha subunit